MFEKGDKYIHFTKYGGVNKGEVSEVYEVHSLDTKNTCTYTKYSILTTKGFSLSLDGSDGRIYKIESELTEESAESLSRVFKKMTNYKHRPKEISKIHNTDED